MVTIAEEQEGFQPQRPPPPSQQNLLNQQISSGITGFTDRLRPINDQFFDIGQGLIDRGLGTGTDPLVEAQRARGLDASRAGLVRRGITGGDFLNAQNRVNAGFNQQALARKDQALQGGIGLQQSALQNLLAEPTLATAQLTANKAGGSGGGGGKK